MGSIRCIVSYRCQLVFYTLLCSLFWSANALAAWDPSRHGGHQQRNECGTARRAHTRCWKFALGTRYGRLSARIGEGGARKSGEIGGGRLGELSSEANVNCTAETRSRGVCAP